MFILFFLITLFVSSLGQCNNPTRHKNPSENSTPSRDHSSKQKTEVTDTETGEEDVETIMASLAVDKDRRSRSGSANEDQEIKNMFPEPTTGLSFKEVPVPVSPASSVTSNATSTFGNLRQNQRSLSTPDFLNSVQGERYWPSLSSDDSDLEEVLEVVDSSAVLDSKLNSAAVPIKPLRKRTFTETKD